MPPMPTGVPSFSAPDPSTLYVVNYPEPVLFERAKAVEKITDGVRAVALRMVELMRKHEGIGLAAPQVGLSWRMFVVDILPTEGRVANGDLPAATDGVQFYINPKLSNPEGAPEPWEEGCLSLPDIRGDVLRPPVITISALDLEGRQFTKRAGGLLARCWQHEMDHLDGVLILDRMTQMSRLKNRAAVKELERK
jgi:peptide deformylase